MKIYLAGPMFTGPHIRANIELASTLRSRGYEVYCPNENLLINDKQQSTLTGRKIYITDIEALEGCNVLLCQGAEDPGAMWEAGYMACLSDRVDGDRYLGCLALVDDIRLDTPPDPMKPGVDNQTFYVNQFVIGGFQMSLGVHRTLDLVLDRLAALKDR